MPTLRFVHGAVNIVLLNVQTNMVYTNCFKDTVSSYKDEPELKEQRKKTNRKHMLFILLTSLCISIIVLVFTLLVERFSSRK